mgnify:FL=1
MPTDDLNIKSTDVTGSEYVTLTSEGTVIRLVDLRNYILQGLLQDVKLDQVDNTADINKPLSSAQRLYIDSRLLAVENKIEQLVTLMSRYIDTNSKL